MNYLDLVEEYDKMKPTEMSQFDKIQALVSRAKDLYEGKTTTLRGLDGRKPTAIAQFEYKLGLIESNAIYKEEDPDDLDFSMGKF